MGGSGRVAATPRGASWIVRGGRVAATPRGASWIVRGDGSRRRRGYHVESPRGRRGASSSESADDRTGAAATRRRYFLLRRENKLNAAHLPRKLVQVLVCRASATQRRAYEAVLGDKRLQHALAGKHADVLASLGRLQKICNHPSLLDAPPDDGGVAAAIARGPRFTGEKQSAKLHVLYRLLRELRRKGDGERAVVVASQTASLALVAKLCVREGWPWVLLDGRTPLKRRQELADGFNDPERADHFCFLLSSTAGGCGLNLIGGSRLVLFDSAWNPAVDKQAAARCWRDGNRRACHTRGAGVESQPGLANDPRRGCGGAVEAGDHTFSFGRSATSFQPGRPTDAWFSSQGTAF